ncbi:MAG: phosphoglucosamine mutase [Candidatus Thorarchaeota archaeon]
MTSETQPPRLFGTSGIRGGLERVSTELALDLGRSLGTSLSPGACVSIGTDARESGAMLLSAFVAGVQSAGVNVLLLGLVPMPLAAFYSTYPNISVSVMLTASHNPPSDNGFKFFRNGREFIRSEEILIEQVVREKSFRTAPWTMIGHTMQREAKDEYLHHLLDFLRSRGGVADGMRVVIDSANGAATNYTPSLLENLGFAVVTMNSHIDGWFPGRPPEPSPANLAETMDVARELGAGVTICHDGDGDRLAVIDERGQFVDQNRVIALFAKSELERVGGGKVVVSIDTSSVIDEIVNSCGGELVRVPLGSLQYEIARDTNHEIVFASEPWKPIFLESGGWMDGILGAARFAQLTYTDGNGKCTMLMRGIPEYPVLREQIHCPDELKSDFMKSVRTLLKSEVSNIDKVLEVDGIRIDRADGSYVLVRVSGTEPKARVYIGARTRETLDKLRQISQRIMEQSLGQARAMKHGG